MGLVRVQAMVPEKLVPLLEKYMRDRGYESVSQAVRRILIEYLSQLYGVSMDDLF